MGRGGRALPASEEGSSARRVGVAGWQRVIGPQVKGWEVRGPQGKQAGTCSGAPVASEAELAGLALGQTWPRGC